MIVGSHYHIGGFVYRYVVSKYIPYSPVDKIIFQAGNLLPDFSKKLSKIEHSIIGSADPFSFHIEKAKDPALSNSERVLSMGVVCHYLSDYFCTYHSKEPFKNHSILRHLLYELRLHFVFCTMLPFSKKLISQISCEIDNIENPDVKGFKAKSKTDYSDIEAILPHLQRIYHSQKSTIRNDIKFALLATLLSTDSVMKKHAVRFSSRLDFETPAPLTPLFAGQEAG